MNCRTFSQILTQEEKATTTTQQSGLSQFRSGQGDTCVLWKAQSFTWFLRTLCNVVFEMVPVLIWSVTARSHPFGIDHQALPPSTLPSTWHLFSVMSFVLCSQVGSQVPQTGVFFLACEDLGRMFDDSFPTCAVFGVFEVEFSSCTLIPLFMTGSVHSGSASLYDCCRMFPDKLRVSLFLDSFPH